MKKLSHIFRDLSGRWYFFPILGVIFLLIINGAIVGIAIAAKNRGKNPEPSPTASPTPIPTSTPTPKPTERPEPTTTPKASSQPTATAKPKATPTATPKPSITPSPTPVANPDVRIHNPKHQQNYSETSIEIEMSVITDKKVEKLEFIVDGQVKKSFTSQPYKATIDLGSGAWELYGKAKLDDGSELTSGTLKFGTGGTGWNSDSEATSSSILNFTNSQV